MAKKAKVPGQPKPILRVQLVGGPHDGRWLKFDEPVRQLGHVAPEGSASCYIVRGKRAFYDEIESRKRMREEGEGGFRPTI